MKVTFFGGAGTVTGSCTLVEHNGLRLLVDCGLPQGSDEKRLGKCLPFKASGIDVVLLSHAHIDHSGRLPLLEKNGFKGRIYSTKATMDLCSIMLEDSARIQEDDAKWKNRKFLRAGKKPVQPLYSVEDAHNVLKRFVPVEYGQITELSDTIGVRFTDAGHMLGSSSIGIYFTEKGHDPAKDLRCMVFSGDIGNLNQPIIKDPEYIHHATFVAMESTYGDRNHDGSLPSTTELSHTLQRIMEETSEMGGKVIIPAFSVGRSQEILYLLSDIYRRTKNPMPIYLDSPLSVKATSVFTRNVDGYYDEEAMALVRQGKNPIVIPTLHAITSVEESKSLNDLKIPCVIISSSGMCEAGRIQHHLKHNLYDSRNTIVFTGYQAEGTLGRKILSGAKQVTILGERIAVRARIEKLSGISGHADKNGLLKWISEFSPAPKKVFVMHGESKVSAGFAQLLSTQMGLDATAPHFKESFEL